MNRKFAYFGIDSGSIARRLTLAFVFLGITATLVTTATQSYRDYHTEFRIINSQLEDIRATHGVSIAASLWHYSEAQIEIELQGLLNNPGFEYAEVTSVDGGVLWAAGEKITPNVIIKEIPLLYSNNGEDHILGSLIVVAGKQIIYDRIKTHAFETLIYFGLWITLLAGIQFLIFRQLVTRHLKDLAKYTSSISFDTQALSSPLTLSRPVSETGSVDELEQVVNAINSMQKKLVEDIDERKQAADALKKSEERFALAMQGANDGLWDWDLKTKEVYYSPRWKGMLGYAEDEVNPNVSEWERLLHPDDKDMMLSEVKAYINGETKKFEVEFRLQHKDGHYVDILSRAFAVKGKEGEITRLVGTHVDITSRKKADEQITFQASHDALTGLVNRREFEHRVERLLSTVKQDMGEHALCYLDLDQFKVVNDTCGHIAGDEMLRQLGSVLQDVVRHRDTLARLGGDEFGVLMEHCSLDDARRVATALQKAIQDYQFSWEGRSFRVGVSIGLVPITISTANLTELLKEADAACYMAKDKGRNRIHIYRPDDTEMVQRHGEMQWVTRLNHALEENRFCLYAQPILPLKGDIDCHYELLLRMIDETGSIIPPGAFLPAAERYNLISNIDRWVIGKAFELLGDNPGFLDQIDCCSINLSGQSLADMDFQQFVINKFKDSDFPPEKICFEITETAAISNLSTASLFITKMRVLGCRFSLDDFGSGLSSFGYLKNLKVDYLKIDGMFVRDIVSDPIDHAMVKSINEIGHVMGMKTIAEFVENDEIKGMLREIGVNYGQGYGICKPQPFDELLGRSNNVTDINNRNNNKTNL
jgi:diguanylate cyclase (GGDEF)-like protein/PAS domain S-box-containing protein